MVDPSTISELLDSLRFDEAEQIAAESDAESELRDEISKRRAAAEREARELIDRVTRLSSEGLLIDLADIAEDEQSRSLLTLIPGSDRRQAEMRLDEAVRWKAYKRRTSVRHLSEARTALDRLDLVLARGLVNKVDGRFLSAEQVEERDRLLLDISARSMELESINEAGRELIDEADEKSGPWWRRWFD